MKEILIELLIFLAWILVASLADYSFLSFTCGMLAEACVTFYREWEDY
jgi:hypothetical protein